MAFLNPLHSYCVGSGFKYPAGVAEDREAQVEAVKNKQSLPVLPC